MSIGTDNITLDDLTPATTAGDLLGYDGSTTVRVPIGTNNQYLQVNTALPGKLQYATITLPTVYYQFIEEKSLTTATSTSFTGLSGIKRYVLLAEIDNVTASLIRIELLINGDSNSSDYVTQGLTASGSTLTGTRIANQSQFMVLTANTRAMSYCHLGLTTDGGGSNYTMSFYSQQTRWSTTDVVFLDINSGAKNTVVTDLTQIDIKSTVTSSMDGRIALYEVTTS